MDPIRLRLRHARAYAESRALLAEGRRQRRARDAALEALDAVNKAYEWEQKVYGPSMDAAQRRRWYERQSLIRSELKRMARASLP